jgi:hypothetical protein|uniref:RING-type domain-containing protein n=1 Tax=viral metagenome TaxID=1070528 RepID=A0A6C0HXH6_9ZZZZ
MTLDAKKNSNMLLMRTIKNAPCVEMDCDICYKKINKKFFECGAPCGKVFHTGCIDKMLDQIEETAANADEEPNYRCCYCRRDIDIENYALQLVAQELIGLHGSLHDASGAIRRMKFLIKNNQKVDEDELFEYYILRDDTHVKKPKQPKREILKKHVRMPRQIRIKQNIGGRRR